VAADADPAAVAIDGFAYRHVRIRETEYVAGRSGTGPPLLLLHGFPESQYCWRSVAPALAHDFTVVVCDLKGYGVSRAPAGGPAGEGYSKREMAAELAELMATLGFERFAVCGHDRGGRVAYRMALDRPDAVTALCVLNIIPTADQFDRIASEVSLAYYPWLFLAQPAPLAERLITAEREFYLRHTLTDWCATPGAITEQAIARYLETFTGETISRMCADYRAAFHIDRAHDAVDREAGRRIACPVLVHWGSDDLPESTIEVWRRWAADVRGGPLPGGHFVPEEAPERLVGSLRAFCG
jgi:haloacetate dehalogenase